MLLETFRDGGGRPARGLGHSPGWESSTGGRWNKTERNPLSQRQLCSNCRGSHLNRFRFAAAILMGEKLYRLLRGHYCRHQINLGTCPKLQLQTYLKGPKSRLKAYVLKDLCLYT